MGYKPSLLRSSGIRRLCRPKEPFGSTRCTCSGDPKSVGKIAPGRMEALDANGVHQRMKGIKEERSGKEQGGALCAWIESALIIYILKIISVHAHETYTLYHTVT